MNKTFNFSDFVLPKFVRFLLTGRCNMTCRMCGRRQDLLPDDMTTEQIFRIIDQLNKAYRFRRKPLIRITGGEPFCREDIFDILNRFSVSGFPISINTNGTLLDRESVRMLSGLNVRYISVSLDALSRETYQRIRGDAKMLDRVLACLRALREETSGRKKLQVNISTVLMKSNLREIRGLLDFTREHGFGFYLQHLMFLDKNGPGLAEPLFGRYAFSNPEGRFLITEQDGVEDVLRFIADEKQFTDYLWPRFPAESIPDYYLAPAKLVRDGYRCSLQDELRIRNNGQVAFCVACDGIHAEWERGIGSVWENREIREFREILGQRPLDPRCARCCMLRKES